MPDFTKIEKDVEPVSSDKKVLQYGTETKPLMNWQAIAIGTFVGILATALAFAFTFQMGLFDNQGRLAFAGWEILLSIVGAKIGKSKRKTWRAMWIGAIVGALSPGFLAIVWVLFVFLIAGSLIG